MHVKPRTCIIAEAGVNHDGSSEQAKRLIDVAADAGADVVRVIDLRPRRARHALGRHGRVPVGERLSFSARDALVATAFRVGIVGGPGLLSIAGNPVSLYRF